MDCRPALLLKSKSKRCPADRAKASLRRIPRSLTACLSSSQNATLASHTHFKCTEGCGAELWRLLGFVIGRSAYGALWCVGHCWMLLEANRRRASQQLSEKRDHQDLPPELKVQEPGTLLFLIEAGHALIASTPPHAFLQPRSE